MPLLVVGGERIVLRPLGDEEPRDVSFSPPVFQLGAEDLRKLSREEIWTHGVERLRWHPEAPPEEWTKEMMLERFSIDTKYWYWCDYNDY